MLIDRSHRIWAIATTLLLVVASLLYIVYARTWPGGPSGRTWPGMLFGVVSALLMFFAGLLAIRKKTIRLRVGTVSWWLKSHIWLSLLSVPLVFFHAAFRWGGTLELLLWLLLALVVASGMVGLVLQNLLPRTMKLQLSSEVIQDQLAEVCYRLVLHTDEKITERCQSGAMEAALRRTPDQVISPETDPKCWLAGFYLDTVRPFLSMGSSIGSPLSSTQQAQLTFERVRSVLPFESHATVELMEESCQERRRLAQQERLYGWLHGWLKFHVPCSIALMVFIVVHALTAMYY